MGALQPIPPAAITRVLATFDRSQLEGFVAVAIDLMDLADGDAELEPSFSEDDAVPPPWWGTYRGSGAGCEISDPAGCNVDDEGERAAWTERLDQSKAPLPIAASMDVRNHEDAEDDDPQGEVTEDDPAFSKRSLRLANRGDHGPGCSIGDPGGECASEDQSGGYHSTPGYPEGPGCPIADPGGCSLDSGEGGNDHGEFS